MTRGRKITMAEAHKIASEMSKLCEERLNKERDADAEYWRSLYQCDNWCCRFGRFLKNLI